ncbi:MAG: 2-C-methyl-D-erythritol 4-phosphate cytidylyltransferase [bacterium]|nr:2-C-methyl-D-erythritol 4-phosphate cytidylyltransferase [bacterium]
MGTVTAILVAGGRGVRLGEDAPKPLIALNSRPLFSYSLQTLERSPVIDSIILVCGADWLDYARNQASQWAPEKLIDVTSGGIERPDSVKAGLSRLPKDCNQIAIHDAARPFVKISMISDAVAALDQAHGSVPGLPLADTLRRNEANFAAGTADRNRYVLTQTPQCFHRDVLEKAFQRADQDGFSGTDDASYVERLPGSRIAIVPGDPDNFKITTPHDLERARMMVEASASTDFRIGEGFDAHRLVAGCPLILGGVEIPNPVGLLGHSDADVLCHGIGDALLGSVGFGDLGKHFPDHDPAYKGISSLLLLGKIADLLSAAGYWISNVDATLILESPKIAPHREKMIANIAHALNIAADRVSVKATTTEGMGFEGRGEGVSCRAVVGVKKTG